MSKRIPHYIESPRHAAMLELRKGSTTQPHDSRPPRERARKDAKRAAIRRSLDT